MFVEGKPKDEVRLESKTKAFENRTAVVDVKKRIERDKLGETAKMKEIMREKAEDGMKMEMEASRLNLKKIETQKQVVEKNRAFTKMKLQTAANLKRAMDLDM